MGKRKGTTNDDLVLVDPGPVEDSEQATKYVDQIASEARDLVDRNISLIPPGECPQDRRKRHQERER
jgi:hypothetical protein